MLDEVLRWHEDGRAVSELWEAAIEVGGPGNITMALARLGPWNRGRLRAEAAPSHAGR